MPQTNSEVIAQCPNPKCQKPIIADHDSPWCFSCGEYFTEKVVAQIPKLQKQKAAVEAYRNVHGGSPVTAVVNRYRDAYRVGAALVGLGNTIKIVGAVLAGIIVLGSLSAGNGPFTLAGSFLAAIVGGLFWVCGVIVAAQGQILRATLDNAVASSHFLTDPERADAMGLPSSVADRSAATA
jgi:hypothetical protein